MREPPEQREQPIDLRERFTRILEPAPRRCRLQRSPDFIGAAMRDRILLRLVALGQPLALRKQDLTAKQWVDLALAKLRPRL